MEVRESFVRQHGRLPEFLGPSGAWVRQVPVEFERMTSQQLQGRSKKELAEMARKKGIAGWHAMRKEDLIAALATPPHRSRKAVAVRARKAARPQAAAARNTSASPSAEEEVERSKYEVGVPTKDLSARVPKDLPSGYG